MAECRAGRGRERNGPECPCGAWEKGRVLLGLGPRGSSGVFILEFIKMSHLFTLSPVLPSTHRNQRQLFDQ